MDYIEAFQNLRSNIKYGRRSPHKAVLMLSVIELFEQNVLSDNEIVYDEALKSKFLNVWNRVFPNEHLFHSEAYLPFWYLQSDSFWHIVPQRGKEDILSLMRDTTIKPSEAKIYDCVRYAELDEDLYFLMTLPSGRSSLKRVLLETYTKLNDEQIDRLAKSNDNAIDYSASALSDYEKMLSNEKDTKNMVSVETDNELVRQFQSLNEDIRIVLNLQYYSFLKSHRNEREMFKDICPTVYDLLDKIIHPIHQGDITPSFAFTYDNFLSDLKIALMSEEDSMELIDKIGLAIDLLRGNIYKVEITEPADETKDISPTVDNIEEATNHEEVDVSCQEYVIENKANRCYIMDDRGERVFSSDGQLIRFNKVFYNINYTDSLISMMIIHEDNKGNFSYGRRILSAHHYSPLYAIIDEQNYSKQFKAVKYDDNCDEYYIQVGERWYGYSGYYADLNENKKKETDNVTSSSKSLTTSIDDEESSDVLEVEHVFLDSSGNIIGKITSSQPDLSAEDRRGKSWTKEEEDLIARYFQQGMKTANIAEKFGRTEVAIKSRLAKLGLIEYTYGQESGPSSSADNTSQEPAKESDFTIENSLTRCSIVNRYGEKVFSTEGKLKYIDGKLYRLNLKNECFTMKSMLFNGSVWLKGEKKIVAYPQTELYKVMENSVDYCNDVEGIVDRSVFEYCRLKVKGVWFKHNGDPVNATPRKKEEEAIPQQIDIQRIIKSPLYAVRKQAILRAMGFFRLPAKIRDIARTISRTAWRDTIKEDDVEEIINTISDIKSVDGGYILRKR